MRRDAGSFVRSRLIEKALLLMVFIGALIGVIVAITVEDLIGSSVENTWVFILIVLALVLLLGFGKELRQPSMFWNLLNMRKGLEAEMRVGQHIEYAITSPGCAVAHSTHAIAKVGDIDHLIVTPVAVWVIETKYRRVPPKEYPKVLSRIAANVKAVSEWAPAGTTVRGCLVLAYETKKFKNTASHNGHRIHVYNEQSLTRLVSEIRGELGQTPTIDPVVAKEVWELAEVGD